MVSSIDQYLKESGGFGRYQMIWIFFLMICLSMEAGMNILSPIFLGYSPNYTCKEYISNTTMYNISEFEDICDIPNITVNCITWDFDDSVLKSSIVTQFDFVCDKKWYAALAKTVSMSGLFFGVLFSALADRFGRKTILLIGIFAILIANVGSAFSHYYMLFLFFRLLVSASAFCVHMVTFVIAVELVHSKYTVHLGYLHTAGWSIGILALTGFAYLLREKQYLEFALIGYGVLLVPMALFTPKSPKWLYAKKHRDEFIDVIERIAKVNGVNMQRITSVSFEENIDDPAKESFMKIFKNFKLLIYTSILCLSWFIASLSTYGLAFIVGSLNGNLYFNSAIMAMAGIPACFGVMMALPFLGRRTCLVGSNLIIGILLLASIGVPEDTPIITVVIVMIGKMFLEISFILLYTYTGEFYPTHIRASGLATCSLFARIGGALSPFILEIDSSNKIALIIFGCCCLLSGILMIFLPETKGQAEKIQNYFKTTFSYTEKETMLMNDNNEIA